MRSAKQVFGDVLERPPGEREDYLAQACAGDPGLRARVEELLSAHVEAETFLQAESPCAKALTRLPEQPGTRLGPYKLVEMIGEGGFGAVFLAEQETPIRRRVAVKIIKLGMDTRQVIARFEAERQALAMMDHPHIARVLDAGTTDAGRPYFVMELVRGVPITRYCDEQHSDLRQRLDLFVDVCHAVQHAHQKGIIHRDLKPSNVLVSRHDDKPVVKVIDFGIAKATSGRLTDQTLHTEWRQLIGTPAFMSPEQAGMSDLDVDTRSDIYSLGVLLYELLAGATPFDADRLKGSGFDELRRIIREEDPPRPSTRLERDARTRRPAGPKDDDSESHSRGARVASRLRAVDLRGDLDWIVMKCLEKDRTRRYETANGLAQDIRRHVLGEPIVAAPPSRTYRLRKLLRRHRGKAVAGLLVVLSLLAAVIGTTTFAVREARQHAIAEDKKREAKEQAAIAEAISRFQSEMFSRADPASLLGDQVTVYQAMQVAVKELDAGELADQPLVEAAVRRTIGNTLRALGRYDEALPNLRRAVDLQRQAPNSSQLDLAASVHDLARLLYARGEVTEATALAREALDERTRLLPAGHLDIAQAASTLGASWLTQGKLAEAEPLLRTALETQRGTLPANHPDRGWTRTYLAGLLRDEGRLAEAEQLCREMLEVHRANLPPDHPETAASLHLLAVVLGDSRRPEKVPEAERFARESLMIRRRILPPDHPDIARSLHALAGPLQYQGKHADAEPLFREALDIFRKSLPAMHKDTGRLLVNLGWTLFQLGKLDEAEAILREAVHTCRQAFSAGNPVYATSVLNLGRTLYRKDNLAEAEPLLREALDLYLRSFQETKYALWPVHIYLGEQTLAWVLRDQGRLDEAEPLLRDALSLVRTHRPGWLADQLDVLGDLLDVLERNGKAADAAALRRDTEPTLPQPPLSGAVDNPPRRQIEALIRFYDAWHAAEPAAGHDTQAAAWRQRLPDAAAAQPPAPDEE